MNFIRNNNLENLPIHDVGILNLELKTNLSKTVEELEKSDIIEDSKEVGLKLEKLLLFSEKNPEFSQFYERGFDFVKKSKKKIFDSEQNVNESIPMLKKKSILNESTGKFFPYLELEVSDHIEKITGQISKIDAVIQDIIKKEIIDKDDSEALKENLIILRELNIINKQNDSVYLAKNLEKSIAAMTKNLAQRGFFHIEKLESLMTKNQEEFSLKGLEEPFSQVYYKMKDEQIYNILAQKYIKITEKMRKKVKNPLIR